MMNDKSRREAILDMFKTVRLGACRRVYDEILDQCNSERKSPQEFLYSLLKHECEIRKDTALKQRIKAARFPQIKDLDSFCFEGSQVEETTIRTLYEADFLAKPSNVIFMGGSGTGKTHLATSIGLSAVHKGKHVKFYNLVDLVNLLEKEKEDGRAGMLFQKLRKVSLIILDELGYLPFSVNGGQLLFHFLSQCYEKKAIVITTNLDFAEWDTIFHSKKMTVAMLDKLTHHCEIIETGSESYRMKDKSYLFIDTIEVQTRVISHQNRNHRKQRDYQPKNYLHRVTLISSH